MNIELFFYTLSKVERTTLIHFVSGILKESAPTSAALTPMPVWLHINRYQMSQRLKNLLSNNRKRLPKYAETITEDQFLMLKGGGVTLWAEYVRLRDALIDDRVQYYPKEDETDKDIR